MSTSHVITSQAHSAGFQSYDFHTTPGVFPTEVSFELLIHVRDLLERAKTVAALAQIVSGIDAAVVEKEPDASVRAKQVLRDAAKAYIGKVCKTMGVDNPVREK